MRMFIILAIFLSRFAFAQEWPLVRTNTLFESLDTGIQVGAEVYYERTGSGTSYQNSFSVGQVLGINHLGGRWLGRSESQSVGVGLNDGASIDATSIDIGSPSSSFLGSSVVGLSGYVWGYRVFMDQPLPALIATNRQINFAPGRTNLLFGFKLFEDGNPDIAYYGWVELLRDRGDAVSQFRFGRHAVDYLPNRGIRAGREPERPALVSVVTPESTTLSWDPLYAAHGFGLERTASLTPPVVWEPVETPPGATNIVIPNTPYSSALFRLARP